MCDLPRRSLIKPFVGFVLLLALPAMLVAQTKRPMTTDDLMRLRGVGGVALSPNGERVLYTISGWEHANARGDTALGDKHDRRSHVWIVPFAGGAARQLTSSERGESLGDASNPPSPCTSPPP